MAQHATFHYKTLDEVKAHVEALGLDLPFSTDLAILGTPVSFGGRSIPNRLACHPMEGCDGRGNGGPSDLTLRRYKRFGAGGAGLIWGEATAVVREARANPRQLWLHDETVADFKTMVDETRAAAQNSIGHDPYFVIQLTHSGRYSRPGKKPAPIIAHHSDILDPRHNLPKDYPLITDEALDALQEDYVRAAQLAYQAGFDAVDIKACHRYLISELLASHTRENSRYGGSFENRIRFLTDTVKKVQQAVPGLEVTSRLNVYDAIAYPFGWGVDRDDYRQADLTEPLQLISLLDEIGYHGLNITIANPYFNPHYGRPFDRPSIGGYIPEEHPLEGMARLLHIVKQVQDAFPGLVIVGTGYSWLRQFTPYLAAGAVEQGWNQIAGLGRGAFAYPDFAKDILLHGEMDPLKVCVSCSSCTQIMRDKGQAGCVIRDSEIYSDIYWEGRQNDTATIRQEASQCLQCVEPTCTAHCPAGIDIPAFLRHVADGNDRDAYRVLRQANVLPEICGFICPVEVQCQGHCIKGYMDKHAMPVARIQRFIADKAVQEGWTAINIPPYVTGKRVAVIGAGPAGLSGAAHLLEQGHEVVVIDRGSYAGGKAASVIPHNRLPREETKEEIHAIFRPISTERLEWRWDTSLGPDYTLDDVLSEGFDAILLAFGLGNTGSLVHADAQPEGVMDALAFLEHMNRNEDHVVHGKVAVIGGGNTAMDAATLAQERGAEDVYLIYRRSFEEMPAWPVELNRAIQKGVHFLVLTQPVGYVTSETGRLNAIQVVRTELGPKDGTGRRRPIELPGTEHAIPVSLVVEAIGEQMTKEAMAVLASIDMTRNHLVKVDPDTWMTSRERIFAAGDLVNGGTTVAQAIAEGKKAAAAIHACLSQG
ncbi:MAG: FAD-dependent oxidoreductase [bacterium]|jgi:NADPH-dependent glutamate synthase beta subunit-like oxidoreductase/2,4-dienoyl-CoA reductase-like NADH-dependent reductase (Old Yellow Enzyme family)|nr:FAD-dependent oxidoreductase [bacterium]